MNNKNKYMLENIWKDTDNRMIAGVISGIAHYFGFNRSITRLIAFCLLVFMPLIIIIGYVALAWLLPPKPKHLYQDEDTQLRAQNIHRNPGATVANLKKRFMAMDRKLSGLEAEITDRDYQLKQKISEL